MRVGRFIGRVSVCGALIFGMLSRWLWTGVDVSAIKGFKAAHKANVDLGKKGSFGARKPKSQRARKSADAKAMGKK